MIFRSVFNNGDGMDGCCGTSCSFEALCGYGDLNTSIMVCSLHGLLLGCILGSSCAIAASCSCNVSHHSMGNNLDG